MTRDDSAVADQEANEDTQKVDLPRIRLHYPQAEKLTQVLEASSSWLEWNVICDPTAERLVQIFAPRLLSSKDAHECLFAGIQAAGLRVIKLNEKTIKVVQNDIKKLV